MCSCLLSGSFLVWEICGNAVAQRIQFEKVRMKLGLRTKVCLQVVLVCNGALHDIGLYGPSDRVSLFLKDWERLGSWVDAARGASEKKVRRNVSDKPF